MFVDDVLDQHVIGKLAIAMLFALLVDAYRDSRWAVKELHAAIGLIYLLPSMPRSAGESFGDIFHADAQLLSSVFQVRGEGDGEGHVGNHNAQLKIEN